MKKLSIALFLFFSLHVNILAQTKTEQKELEVEFHQLRDSLYMVVYDWPSRITLSVGKDGILLVDAGLRENAMIIHQAIKEKFNNIPIKLLINTHGHIDHAGGNREFMKTGTVTIAHQDAKKWMQNVKIGDVIYDPELDQDQLYYKQDEFPVITFSDRMEINFNNEKIILIHQDNAHSKGDVFVHFTKNNVLAVGDIYFGNSYSMGNMKGLIRSYEEAIEIMDSESILVPGHGIQSNEQELKAYLAMVRDVRNKIKAQIEAGKTLEEIKADNNITAAYDSKYGTSFIKGEHFRQAIYLDLQ